LIEETGEVFTDYEKFLNRCENNGVTSNMSSCANVKQARLLRAGKLPSSLIHCETLELTALQKKFTCESTGHSGFTFFEAKESEVRSTPVLEKGSLIVTTPQSEASKEINSILPEALRSRVLEYVQFQTTSRLDDLGKLFATLRRTIADVSQ
jgi:hypothetical protein